MASFESTRNESFQQHIEIVVITLPVITGSCSLKGSGGFGTPLTCEQSWGGEYKNYYFTRPDAKPGLGWIYADEMYNCVETISEKPTELKPGDGLASRGSLNITFNDFVGDPNIDAPGVSDEVYEQGTYFGKFNARNVVENADVELRLYRLNDLGNIDFLGGYQSRKYKVESLKRTGRDKWQLMCKDVLSALNISEKQWPITTNGFLRQDASSSTTELLVDGKTLDDGVTSIYSVGDVLRINDEFIKVTGVNDSNLADVRLTVTRNSIITAPVSGETLTRNEISDHTAGDEIFICYMSDDETIDALLTKVLTDVDVDPSLIPSADWAAEMEEWHSATRVNTLWYESKDANAVIKKILNSFLVDMWFDPVDSEVKISAISVWKESSAVLNEGVEIDYESVKITPVDTLRTTRALAVYDKRFLARDDSISNYAKASQYTYDLMAEPEFYGEHKDKIFEPSTLLTKDSGDLLVQRTVSRFYRTPEYFSWKTQEKKLNYKVGDIVDISSLGSQSFDGSTSSKEVRAQVLSITPKYTKTGREYLVKALTYEPAFVDGTELPAITGTIVSGLNLWVLAGSPAQPVTLTFVFDGAQLGSPNDGTPSIVAGNFTEGSKINIVLANGADLRAIGGEGGDSAYEFWDQELQKVILIGGPVDGGNGGVVYNAQGVDTDIYVDGAVVPPEVSEDYPIGSGVIEAPGGGGGGACSANYVGQTLGNTGLQPGASGGGGAGRPGGQPGTVWTPGDFNTPYPSASPAYGDEGTTTTGGAGGQGLGIGPGATSPFGPDGADGADIGLAAGGVDIIGTNPFTSVGGDAGTAIKDTKIVGNFVISDTATIRVFGTPSAIKTGSNEATVTYMNP